MTGPEERAEAPEETIELDAGTLGPSRPPRPLHLRARYVLLVFVGGMAGALARYGLSHVLPAPGGWPLPTLVENLAGAFALGLLLEALVRRGADTGGRRLLRLLAGTGFLGAFTTYSTLALETNQLLLDGRAGAAAAYVAASVIGGLLTAWAGVVAGAARHRCSTSRAAGKDTERNDTR